MKLKQLFVGVHASIRICFWNSIPGCTSWKAISGDLSTFSICFPCDTGPGDISPHNGVPGVCLFFNAFLSLFTAKTNRPLQNLHFGGVCLFFSSFCIAMYEKNKQTPETHRAVKHRSWYPGARNNARLGNFKPLKIALCAFKSDVEERRTRPQYLPTAMGHTNDHIGQETQGFC